MEMDRGIWGGMAGRTGRCLSINWIPTVTGSGNSAALIFPTDNLERTLRSRACPTTKCASETGFASAGRCLGIRGALVEISQPRVTCYRVGIRMDEPRMAALLVAQHRPGFYFRVLEEGEVGAGDEIIKVAEGAERMSVAEIDGALYLRGHTRDQLERALRIPALSAGWKESFRALLEQEDTAGAAAGNAGLAPSSGAPPAWAGFRPLRVSRIEKESATVKSFSLMPADDRPLVAALAGQFIILRIKPNADGPPVLRNYSLSDLPSDDHYRVSVKLEENGAASTYLHTHVGVGDVLDVAAPRGAFTLGPDGKKVVLISAGVGATPVLAMLHALAGEASPREIWWLYGARNRDDHPFAEETLNLIKSLPSAKSYVEYSRPGLEDRVGIDFDAAGRIGTEVLQKIGVPHDADFYLCGPAAFMDDLTAGLKAWGVADDRVHGEIFGPSKAITPGIADAPHAPPHAPVGPAGIGPQISFARSGLNARWDPKFGSLLDFAEACEVPVRWSCRTGVCHMCESGLISGNVKYQPDPLDPPAQGNLLLCCAQPAGDIVLDL